MTRVKIENIIDHLGAKIRRALTEAVNNVDSDIDVDERELYLEFRRAIRRRCSAWEQVPDQYVD